MIYLEIRASARRIRRTRGIASHDLPLADSLDPAGAHRKTGSATITERTDPIPVTTAVIRLPRLVEREPPLPRR